MATNKAGVKRGWHFNTETRNLEAYNNGNEIFQYPFGVNYYVTKADGAGSGSGVDTNSGLSWAQSFLTIQTALDAAATATRRGGVKIFVGPGGYTETLTTPLNNVTPFGELIAVNPTPGRSFGAVYLTAGSAGETVLTVQARGWRIKGFEFDALADAKCVVIGGSASNTSGQGTLIEDCLFVGQQQGLYGIDAIGDENGTPLCCIRNCGFYGFKSGSTAAKCITCTNSDTDQPSYWLVEDCWFADSDNLIDMEPRGFKESTIRYNTFYSGGANQNADEKLNNSGGRNSQIYGNAFGGAYTTAGGYVSGTGDDWSGNMAEDVAGEAANGWTYAIPAAA